MKKLIAGIVIALVLGSALGYAVGHTLGYGEGSRNVAASYASKIAAVNKLFPAPPLLSSISGKIKSISGSAITIDADPVTQNPFADQYPSVRTVTVTDKTTATKLTQKDPAAFQKEMMDFQKTMQHPPVGTSSPAVMIQPPTLYSQTNISLSDLKVGDRIQATAASDIATSTSFTATQIQVTNPQNLEPKI